MVKLESLEDVLVSKIRLLEALRKSTIAIETGSANEQHC